MNDLTQEAHARFISALLTADGEAQSTIASAQAGGTQTAASASAALATANDDYANLLAIEESGMDHALRGNATGARSQSGHYHYDIAGS